DIETLFRQVPVNTTVRIVNQRFKAGWHQGVLYLEAHAPLEETPADQRDNPQALREAIVAATRERPDYPVNWMATQVVAAEATGIPTPVGPPLTPSTLAGPDMPNVYR